MKTIVLNAMPSKQLNDWPACLVSLEVVTHCQGKKPKFIRWNCISFFSVSPLNAQYVLQDPLIFWKLIKTDWLGQWFSNRGHFASHGKIGNGQRHLDCCNKEGVCYLPVVLILKCINMAMGQKRGINLKTFHLCSKDLVCLHALFLLEFSLLSCYFHVLITDVPSASPFFLLSLPCISQETALIVTPFAPKHHIVLFWPQNRVEMQCEGTEMGFGLQALDFSFGPTHHFLTVPQWLDLWVSPRSNNYFPGHLMVLF